MGNIHAKGKRKENSINGNSKRRRTGSSSGSSPRSKSGLSELLTEEYFLEKILSYLVADGFYECRFVCQKWKTVCDKLPVKLGPLSPERLKEAHEKFPNACSVNNLISTLNIRLEEVLQDVAAFARLRDLSMFIDVDMSISLLPPSLIQTFNGLQSLDIDWDCEFPCSEVLSFLGHLTNLTSLRVSSSADLQPPGVPLTELQKIESLDLQFSLFVYQDGEHVFPSLTNLTHLELYEFTDDVSGPDVLQALSPFKESLQSLSLEFDSCLLEDIDLSPLQSYPNLGSVKLSGIIERGADLFPVLRKMNNITDLHISHIGFASLSFTLLNLFAITGLRSLWLDIIGDSIMEEAPLFPPFPNLTQLEIIGRGVGGSLRCLSTLVQLSLSLEGEETDAFLDSLVCMPRLETLKIKHGAGLNLRGYAFSSLKRLKFLQLEGRADVQADFFPSLISLPELTKLVFDVVPWNEYRYPFSITQVCLLTQLTSLGIFLRDGWMALDFFQYGQFPRLRRLEVWSSGGVSPDEEAELYRRLPCLCKLDHSQVFLDCFDFNLDS